MFRMFRKVAGVVLLLLLISSHSIFLAVNGASLSEIAIKFAAMVVGALLGVAVAALAIWLLMGGKRA